MAYARRKEPAAAAPTAAAEQRSPAATAAERRPRAAPSVLAQRERILMLASRVADAVKRFRRKYTDKADDDFAEVYDEFLKPVLQRMSSKDDLKDWRDMNAAVIAKFKDDVNVCKRQDYKSLAVVCRRAAALSALLDETRPLLERAHAHAGKFLVSLASVASRQRFASVDEYENRLNEFRRDVAADLESVAKLTQELEAVRPISRYLNEYGKVLHYMREVSDRLGHCASVLRQWAVADEEYVARGEKELRRCVDGGAALRSRARAGMAAGRYDVEHGPSRRAGNLRRAQLSLLASRERLVSLRERAAAAADDHPAAAAAAAGGASLEDAFALPRWRSAPPDCQHQPVVDSGAAAAAAEASGRPARAAAGGFAPMGRWDSERRSLADAVDAAAHAVQAAENELSRRLASAERFKERLAAKSQALADTADGARTTVARANALAHVLSLKKDAMTLKKIEHDVFNIDGGDTQGAVRRAATTVGPSWPKLYAQLAFTPARSDVCRANDVEVIRRIGERWGQTDEEMASKALSKWVRKSCSASSNELDYAVQRLRRLGSQPAPVRLVG